MGLCVCKGERVGAHAHVHRYACVQVFPFSPEGHAKITDPYSFYMEYGDQTQAIRLI